MAYCYLFFEPRRLPLTAQDLSEETVVSLNDRDVAREALSRVMPEIEWVDQTGKATINGMWFEFNLPGDGRDTLSLRCSLRADYRAIVQHICDELGWVAFDERPMCYQPHQTPFFAG